MSDFSDCNFCDWISYNNSSSNAAASSSNLFFRKILIQKSNGIFKNCQLSSNKTQQQFNLQWFIFKYSGPVRKNRFSMAVTIIWASTWLQGRNEAVTVVSNRFNFIQWRFLSFRGPFSFSGFSFSSWSLSDSNGFSREKIFNSEYPFYHW